MTTYHNIMRSEVKADVYAGDNCDEVKPYFNTYCDGDKQDDDHSDNIVISLKDLPPGARIDVTIPCCPDCGLPRDAEYEFSGGGIKITGHKSKCNCGFDWDDWVLGKYS